MSQSSSTVARSASWLSVARSTLLACAVLWGCSAGDDEDNMPAAQPTESDDGNPNPLTLNGCSAASYVDESDDNDERVIQIAAFGLKFTPPCLQIAAGQTVRFEGSLTAHPLAPGTPDNPSAGSPESPIERTSSGSSLEVTFEEPGTYPYYCELHGFGSGMGMVGAVRVR